MSALIIPLQTKLSSKSDIKTVSTKSHGDDVAMCSALPRFRKLCEVQPGDICTDFHDVARRVLPTSYLSAHFSLHTFVIGVQEEGNAVSSALY